MTHPVDSDADTGTVNVVRPLSRREARKEWLEQQAADSPKSIFDLPYVPRKRRLPPPDPVQQAEHILDPEVTVEGPSFEGEVVSVEHAEDVTEIPAPISAASAALTVNDAFPSVLPSADAAPEVEPPPFRPELSPPAQPESMELVVHPKPSESIEGTLLFDRIPEPAYGTPVSIDDSDEVQSLAQLAPAGFSPRRKIAGGFAVIAAFGMMLTMALPAIAPSAEDTAVAAGGQVLFSGGGTQARLDIESFESIDELEAAADAATLEAETFTNNPSAEVQYPFSRGVPLTDGFGPRAFPVSGFHDAQDFAAGYGAAVRSIAAGTVIESGPSSDGCGFGLKIEHRIDGQTVHSRYCHLASNPLVAIGEQVRVGQFVALVGNSGLSFGPHLHLVIEVDGEAVDPMVFIAKYNQPRPAAVSSSTT